jgi:hypothetical protein
VIDKLRTLSQKLGVLAHHLSLSVILLTVFQLVFSLTESTHLCAQLDA